VTFEELVRIMVAADIKGLEEVQQCQDVIRQIMNNNTKP
jgi:hypothetical protein